MSCRPGRHRLGELVPTVKGIILYPQACGRLPASFPAACRWGKHLTEVRVASFSTTGGVTKSLSSWDRPIAFLAAIDINTYIPPSYEHARSDFCFLSICRATTNFCADSNKRTLPSGHTSWQAQQAD